MKCRRDRDDFLDWDYLFPTDIERSGMTISKFIKLRSLLLGESSDNFWEFNIKI